MKTASPLTARIALVLAIIACGLSLWNTWRLPTRTDVQIIAEAEGLREAMQQAVDEKDRDRFFSLIYLDGFEEQIGQYRTGWEPIFAFKNPQVEILLHNRRDQMEWSNDETIWSGKPCGWVIVSDADFVHPSDDSVHTVQMSKVIGQTDEGVRMITRDPKPE